MIENNRRAYFKYSDQRGPLRETEKLLIGKELSMNSWDMGVPSRRGSQPPSGKEHVLWPRVTREL